MLNLVCWSYVELGSFFELLHNSYLKGGLALSALLGPGRGWLYSLSFVALISMHASFE